MKRNETWTWRKFRHKLTVFLLRPIFTLVTVLRYHVKIEKFPEQGNRPFLIIMNHQTAFDQFFVSIMFNRPVYYVASEDIFSLGFLSDALRFLVAPIPIKKQTLDLQAVKNCIKVAREGGTIALAPEGNRTYHGRTLYMKPGIASMVKKLGLPLAIFRIDGGYGIHPRWSDVVRGGKMRCYISRVIEPEEYANMTGDELFSIIQQELWADEGRVTGNFPHKKNAEFLERAMYVCPYCGEKTEVYSRITGYYRPVQNWNDGKAQEYKHRKLYDIPASNANHPEIGISSEIGCACTPVMVNAEPAAAAAAAPVEEPTPVTPAPTVNLDSDNQTLLFATKTCPNCKMAERFLSEAGMAYTKLYAEDAPEMIAKFGIKQAHTLVHIANGTVMKVENVSNIRRFIETQKA